MKLYYMQTMHPRKVCALAKHLGLPVDYVLMKLEAGELKAPNYLALNPNGRVPVLEDAGKTIWESAAIMAYLAIRAGSEMWPATEPMKQVEVLRWISWDNCEFGVNAKVFYLENYLKPKFGWGTPDKAALEAKTPALHKAARVLDSHLATRDYLVGNKLTIADFCVAVLLPEADQIKLPLSGYAHIQRWHDQLMQLPAWREPWPDEA